METNSLWKNILNIIIAVASAIVGVISGAAM